MILTDAGPLVALIDGDEPDHRRCTEALVDLSLPLLTTWPAFTEAMYLLGGGGWRGQEPLWRLVLRKDLALAEEQGLERIFSLDADFHIYRLHGKKRFEVLPG